MSDITDITQFDGDAIRAELRAMPGNRWYRVVVEWADKTLTDDLLEISNDYLGLAMRLHLDSAAQGRGTLPAVAMRLFSCLGEIRGRGRITSKTT